MSWWRPVTRVLSAVLRRVARYVSKALRRLARFVATGCFPCCCGKIPQALHSSPPRLQALRSKELNGTGASIRAYALHLSADKSTTFAQNIDNFIACTCESRETSPQVVMRNMRQFMSGMKNYLVKHGEREFEKEVEKERVKVSS
uniref:Uncharacterized protein n=1 Tax=Timema shepardi TaxID=629360 RepID=A0A7R9B5N2_TIMSH|nr:unnamed protein product [Timema shepardi]